MARNLSWRDGLDYGADIVISDPRDDLERLADSLADDRISELEESALPFGATFFRRKLAEISE